jgi:hypothetical protein
MKRVLLSLSLIFLACAAFAQSPLPKGTPQLNFGVGFSNWGVPVYGGLDYAVHDNFSIGVEVSYRKYKEYWKYGKHNYYSNYNASIWGFSFNGNYHFNKLLEIPKEWDLYAGLNVGYVKWVSDYTGYTENSGLGLGAQVGGRYYFTDKFGLNLELGGGNRFSSGKFGISIKLK